MRSERLATYFYEAKFFACKDGKVYSNGNMDSDTFSLYLELVDKVVVYCRLKSIESSDGGDFVHIDHPGVEYKSIGVDRWISLLWCFPVLLWKFARAWFASDLVVFRLPSFVSILLMPFSFFRRPVIITEIVSDPDGLLLEAYPKSILISVLNSVMTFCTRRWVKISSGANYVTRFTLQKRYPTLGVSSYGSNVRISSLDGDSFAAKKDCLWKVNDRAVIGLIGSLENEYKGVDVAIHSVFQLNEMGRSVELQVVGDGRLMAKYKELVSALELDEKVHFLGRLPKGKPVLDWLGSLDAYVQPSRVEGLPRAMIEAMSVGVPCIGSSVGGVPELLSRDWLVRSGSSEELAEKVDWLFSSEDIYNEHSCNCFHMAEDFLYERIVKRKIKMIKLVSDKCFH